MSKGQLNAYVCDDLHVTITVDIDDGTTPFIIGCPVEGCGCAAMSRMYRLKTGKIPTFEFYRKNDLEAESLEAGEKAHHEHGGLFLRPISANIPEQEFIPDTELNISINAGNIVRMSEAMAIISSINDQSSPKLFNSGVMDVVTFIRNKFSGDALRLIPSKYLYSIEEAVKIKDE